MDERSPASILALLIVLMLSGVSARAADPFGALVARMSGLWNCSSVADGKTTQYFTTWSCVAETRWLRGVNRSGASQSLDMETYDTRQHLWRIVDLGADGSMSVLTGAALDSNHVTTQSHYPDATQTVRYDRLTPNRYALTFDFIIGGKSMHWVDDCTRQ
ncbi:MAG: hypothetical protein WBW87_15380 [Candidatus Cybelea sp.]